MVDARCLSVKSRKSPLLGLPGPQTLPLSTRPVWSPAVPTFCLHGRTVESFLLTPSLKKKNFSIEPVLQEAVPPLCSLCSYHATSHLPSSAFLHALYFTFGAYFKVILYVYSIMVALRISDFFSVYFTNKYMFVYFEFNFYCIFLELVLSISNVTGFLNSSSFFNPYITLPKFLTFHNIQMIKSLIIIFYNEQYIHSVQSSLLIISYSQLYL